MGSFFIFVLLKKLSNMGITSWFPCVGSSHHDFWTSFPLMAVSFFSYCLIILGKNSEIGSAEDDAPM